MDARSPATLASLDGARILVTGGTGSLGFDLMLRLLRVCQATVVVCTRDEDKRVSAAAENPRETIETTACSAAHNGNATRPPAFGRGVGELEVCTVGLVAISVIVPVYEGARYLPLGMESLRVQTSAPREVIVVDDGSRDATSEVASALGAKLPCDFVLLRQENAGLASAMNAGLARARGDWVLELDADDYLVPQALERFASAVGDGIDVVASHFDCFRVRRPAFLRAVLVARIRWPLPTTEEFERENTVIATSLARRARIEACGGWDERLTAHQDWDLWLRMWTGENFVRVPEPLVKVYRHMGSMSADHERMVRHRAIVRQNWRDRYAGVPSELL